MNEQEIRKTKKQTEWAINKLLPFIKMCPHVIKSGIGIDAFINELNEASELIDFYNPEIIDNANELNKIITTCPFIFKAEMGAVAFTNELIKASKKYVSNKELNITI